MTMVTSTTAPAHRVRVLRGFAICVVILGLLFLGPGAWNAAESVRFAANGIAADARLIGITKVGLRRGGVAHYARVSYTAFGKLVIASTENRIVPANHRIGDTLRVTYLSGAPERVRLADGGGWTWLILGLGIVITSAGVLWLMRLRRPA